jgi:Flp pilus assembly pilin Flp
MKAVFVSETANCGVSFFNRLANNSWGGNEMIYDAINRAITRAYVGLKREDGQTFVEYSLIGVLVAVALVLALGVFKTSIVTALQSISSAL